MKRALVFAALIVSSAACGDTSTSLRSTDEAPSTAGGKRDAGAASTVRDAGKPGTTAGSKPTTATMPGVSNAPDAPPPLCDSIDIATGRVPPDVLIVLDRSSSMKSGNVDRWDPSVSGLTSITAKLESQIRFGLMAFPGGGNGGGGNGERCAPGELDVPIELNNAAPIAVELQGYQLVNSTPTAGTLEAAHKVLEERMAPADMGVKGTPYVVLVTDGAPNCSDAAGGLGGFLTGGGNDQQALDDSIKAIESMAKDGIKTFVLGYDANSDPQLRDALDRMAVAGDTGDTEHHEIENETGLVEAFTAIAGQAVSCDFVLSEPPADPSYVLVKVSGTQLNFGDPNGWTLSDDKLTLTLLGDACNALPQVSGSHVSVQVQCTQVMVM